MFWIFKLKLGSDPDRFWFDFFCRTKTRPVQDEEFLRKIEFHNSFRNSRTLFGQDQYFQRFSDRPRIKNFQRPKIFSNCRTASNSIKSLFKSMLMLVQIRSDQSDSGLNFVPIFNQFLSISIVKDLFSWNFLMIDKDDVIWISNEHVDRIVRIHSDRSVILLDS